MSLLNSSGTRLITSPPLGPSVAGDQAAIVGSLLPVAPVAAVVLAWVPLVLLLDRGADLGAQRLLGLGTWVLLLALLRRESPQVGAQVAVVIAFATAVEYTFSPLLEVYVYRLGNVPAFVPPGHGLIYLAALDLARSARFARYRRLLVVGTVAAGGAYAGWGLLLSDRPDVLGAFWYACLLLFLWRGRAPLLYVGAFVVVTYLEVLGTWIGTWEWQLRDPTGWVSIGNPPSGAAGGYGWFDLAAVLGAPAVLRAWERLARAGCSARRETAEHDVVQEAVGGDGAAGRRAGTALQVGEPPARLLDDERDRGQVVQRDLGLGGDVDRALGHQHVGPEVAVRPGPPGRGEQVEEGPQPALQ